MSASATQGGHKKSLQVCLHKHIRYIPIIWHSSNSFFVICVMLFR